MPDSMQRGATRHDAFVMVPTITPVADVMGISQSAVRKPYQREHMSGHAIDQQWHDMPDQTETSEYEPSTLRLSPNQAQLEAFYDAILRPHLDRIEELAKHVGQLTAERDAAITAQLQAEQRLASDRALIDLAAAAMERSMTAMAAD